MKNIFQKTILSLFFLTSFANAEEECIYFSFDGWKECFIQNKLHGTPSPKALELLNNAKLNERVVALDGKQPESKLDFAAYLNNIGFKNKVIKGREFLNKNRTLLNEISQQFGVEPEIIVALVGIESEYGQRLGKFNTIDSITSLAYDGRRRDLFESQMLAAIEIAEQDNLSYEDFKGSWAGAMGQCQFMPSSIRDFAVDYNKDGYRDIWQTKADVFASAANYLKINGWTPANSVIAKYQLNSNKTSLLDGLDPSICDDSSKLCKLSETLYLLSQENDGIIQPTFLVGSNFNVLMKWNKSYHFSLSVLMIADQLKKA